MIMLGNKKWIIIFLSICFLGGFLITLMIHHRPRVKFGEDYIYCNPGAVVKPDREYRLRLWDTDWPVLAPNEYKVYLENMVRDFQQIYPNIKVDITLNKFGAGLEQLAAALKSNSAPDVYCSVFQIPDFDNKRQIPVGFWLKPKEKEAYFPEVRKLVSRFGVECCFPRWTVPSLWVGNQYLWNLSGYPVVRMQKPGYSIDELKAASQKLPKGKYALAGNLGHNGLFTDLAVNSSTGTGLGGNFLPSNGVAESLNHLNELIGQRKTAADFESNMLGRFLAGDVLLLGGVRPIVYRFLKHKLAETPGQKHCKPILLPSPGMGRKRFLVTENGVVCVYRNRYTAGDDHITAAVKLGHFISTYEKTKPFQDMMLIPAARKSAGRWCRELRPVIGDVSFLTELIENGTLLNLPDYQVYQREIYPVLQEFFARKTSLENVRERLKAVNWR